MSNIISDYNKKNNPTDVGDLELPDKAAKVAQQPDVVYPDFGLPKPIEQERDQYGNLPTIERNTLQDYTPLPEPEPKKPIDLGNFISPAVTVEYPQQPLDLTSNLPTDEEFAQQVTEEHQRKVDWLSAQVANYTPSTVLDITAGGLNYELDTPGVGLSIPDNLYWEEERAAQQQAAYQQQQAELNQQGFNIEPQTNVTAQQGGFNSGGTAQQGWSIGGLFNDVVGLFNLGARVVQSTAEGAIGRPIKNPLDVAEAVVRSNPVAVMQEFGAAAIQGKQQQYLDKYKTSFGNNFVKKPLTPNETNLLAGGISQKGPVNLSRAQFGEQGSGVLGAVNYGLDNFLGGNALIRAPLANIKRNVENARAGRPQQWDEGLGVIAAFKGQSYSALADSNDNPDTSFVGKDKHGQDFWVRAAGGLLYDAVTDLSPLAIIKKGIKQGGKIALSQGIKNVPVSSVAEMAKTGQVIVEVTKKGGQQDLRSVSLNTILSPEKQAYYQKKGLVVVGAKKVSGPSQKALDTAATREAKRVAKGKKPKSSKTPKAEYEFITMKEADLIQASVSSLTPSGTDILNKVVSAPTQLPPKSASEIIDGYRVPVDPKTGKKIYPRDASGAEIKSAEALQAARTAKTKSLVDNNPLLQDVVYGPKTRRASVGASQERLAELELPVVGDASKARDVEVLPPDLQPVRQPVADIGGEIVDVSVKSDTAVLQSSPVAQAVKQALLEPELPQSFRQQLLQPGAAENIIKQAEADGAVSVSSSGVMRPTGDNTDVIAEAQKELIRLRLEQSRLRNTPSFDLVGQPGTKLGNELADIQTRVTQLKETINGGRVRKEFYEQLDPVEVDRVIPVLRTSLSNVLPTTPSSLFSRLKQEGRVFMPGELVERSLDDLTALALYLGHTKSTKSLTSDAIDDLRTQYGMVYSRVGEQIDTNAIRQYLDNGVAQLEVNPGSVDRPRETVLIRRQQFTVIPGGKQPTLDEMSLADLFKQVDAIGSKYDGVELPEAERFAQRRQASEFTNEVLAPRQERFAAGAEELGVSSGVVVPLRPKSLDNVLEITKDAPKKYAYASTGEPAPERGVYQRLQLLSQKQDELLVELATPQANLPELEKQLDQVSLLKQQLEELDPTEAAKTQKYFESMPVRPSSTQAETAARLVREAEQRVDDTTQIVRDINEEIEFLRADLDQKNAYLKASPQIEPQPLDVGTYNFGTTSDTLLRSGYTIKPSNAKRELTSLGEVVRDKSYWFGSSFGDALMTNAGAVNPTRNYLGLGHYIYLSSDEAEDAARALLPDNHVDAGLTPNENGFLQQVIVTEVKNPFDLSYTPGSVDDSIVRIFQSALVSSFDPEDVTKLKQAFTNGMLGSPVSTYWDLLSDVWGRTFPTQPVPEALFRKFEVNVADQFLSLGHDTMYFEKGLVVLDNRFIEAVGKTVELAPSNYYTKAVAYVNQLRNQRVVVPSNKNKVFSVAAEIDAGEAYIDDLMSKLSSATSQSEIALEQLFRQEEALEATLNSDTVSRQLSAQEDAAEQVVRDTDAILKQNDEHPSCL